MAMVGIREEQNPPTGGAPFSASFSTRLWPAEAMAPTKLS